MLKHLDSIQTLSSNTTLGKRSVKKTLRNSTFVWHRSRTRIHSICSYFCLKLSYMDCDNIVNEDGFVSLFNGLDLQGWRMAGCGKSQVVKQESDSES